MAMEEFDIKCDGSVRDTEFEALRGNSSISTATNLKPTYATRRERVLDESKRGTTVVRVPYVHRPYKALVRLKGSVDETQRSTLGRLFGETQ